MHVSLHVLVLCHSEWSPLVKETRTEPITSEPETLFVTVKVVNTSVSGPEEGRTRRESETAPETTTTK